MKALLSCLAGCLCGLAMAAAGMPAAHAASERAGDATATPATLRAAGEERRILMMLRMPVAHYRPDQAYGGGYRNPPDGASRRRIARKLARAHGLRLVEGWPMPALGIDCYVLEAASVEAGLRELPRLLDDPRVESAQMVQRFRALSRGTEDPLALAQPALHQWRLQELHRVATGRGVLVASIDSGLDAVHPDLRGQDIATRNFVDGQAYRAEAHGTAVGGIIVARRGNGAGIVGIAPDASLLALRACTQGAADGAVCDTFGLAKALQFALNAKAQVVNLSLTGPSDVLLGRLIDVALRRGAVVVGAVDPLAADAGFPANHRGVLAVTTMDDPRARARGVVHAPGRGIPAPLPGGGWALVSGSSFASAQVSGLVALLFELKPRMAPGTLASVIAPAPALGLAAKRPPGVDACRVVAQVWGRCACGCADSPPEGARSHR
jgi:hypothetical protein